ncbi:hypothetical protein AJ88_19000 [Mesorhizobium amorphae CCBAU 01583]|nr:hypothetical protein AJ88_19000 [Mesorhizobium amorphae CCBAU 01583]
MTKPSEMTIEEIDTRLPPFALCRRGGWRSGKPPAVKGGHKRRSLTYQEHLNGRFQGVERARQNARF